MFCFFFPWTFDPLKIPGILFMMNTVKIWSQLGQFSKALRSIYLSRTTEVCKRNSSNSHLPPNSNSHLPPNPSLVHRKAEGPRGMRRRERTSKARPPTGGWTHHSRSSGKARVPGQALPHGSLLLRTPQCPEALDVVWKIISERPLLKEARQMMVHAGRVGDKGKKKMKPG